MDEIVTLRGSRHVVSGCISCGVVYTIPEVVYDQHKQEGGFHHCPNGHSQGWTKEKSERERLRRERDLLKQDAARLNDELEAERARVAAAEKKLDRAKKRASAGVCPCCTRTFSNVQRHMQTKHPNVVPLEKKAARA